MDHEPVVDEVKINLECARTVGDGRCGQTARRYIEGYVPGVIDPRRLNEPDFADNLCPQV
ncbi:protein of unknown function [Candidatus Nitrotoga arctica]|uniref:Uncharacterized protein n=1 Tax=Candidatus Nitrotoga arctica TaxID=453162 RepID=A0ABM8Z190_9PROT|nr:protein of unknown function [Candidatus Nitrotoga arctica]